MRKLTNANYLHDVPVDHLVVNEQNRGYIDRFVSENYKRLSKKFMRLSGNINSSGFGAMDKLNETIVSLYTDPALCFADWGEAERYMSSKFTEKEIRIPVKKPMKDKHD
jgi:hypothetical protein